MSRLSAVLIDEAQFLRPEQIDQLFMLVVAHAIPVMTWGLRVDFRTHLFPGSRRLLELAHVVREAITMCGHGDGCENRAHLNARLVNGVYVHQGEQIAIDDGPEVSYKALCPKHYLQNVGQITADPA